MTLHHIALFMIVYLLFCLSGAFFRLDRAWYDKLIRPTWTPPGGVIGLIWIVLYGCIALATTLVFTSGMGSYLYLPLAWFVVNWFVNQSFTYWMFARKNLGAAFWMAISTCITAIGMAASYVGMDWRAGLLLVPYVVWTAVASRLAWLIASKNPA